MTSPIKPKPRAILSLPKSLPNKDNAASRGATGRTPHRQSPLAGKLFHQEMAAARAAEAARISELRKQAAARAETVQATKSATSSDGAARGKDSAAKKMPRRPARHASADGGDEQKQKTDRRWGKSPTSAARAGARENPVRSGFAPQGPAMAKKALAAAVSDDSPWGRATLNLRDKPPRYGGAGNATDGNATEYGSSPRAKNRKTLPPLASRENGRETSTRQPRWEKTSCAAAPSLSPAVTANADAEAGSSAVRLCKLMAARGLCSRREADLWIERGWVRVNGQVLSDLGGRVAEDAVIDIDRAAVDTQAQQVTILLHKPVGYVSGQPEDGHETAMVLLNAERQDVQVGDPAFQSWMLRGLAPAGRLDSDSSGLLVFTQDGRVAKTLIGEMSGVEKEYLVRVSGHLINDGLALLRHGLSLDGKPLKPAWVKQLNEDQLHFILREGKKRQIRRMCEQVGLKVIGLKRVRIGRVMLGGLAVGRWRFLRPGERF